MCTRRIVRSSLACAALVASVLAWGPSHGAGAITRTLERIAGADRYQTAVDLSVAAFPTGADTAVIASGAAFPDGLTAGPLAALLDGPVLLTTPDGLPPQVAGELQRLGVDQITVVGGPAAVQDVVLDQIQQATGIRPDRVAGGDRYATAAAVADRFPTNPPAVFAASGVTFPDALAGGAAAARLSAPLVLVQPDAVPDSVGAALARLAPPEIRVLGGAAAVSDAVVANLQTRAASVRRIAGADRFATAAVLATDGGAGIEEALVTTGIAFPDALAASSLATARDAPILLTDTSCAPNVTVDLLRAAGWPDVTAVGGTTAVSAFAASLVPCVGIGDGTLAPGVTLTTQVLPGPVVAHILTVDRDQGYELRTATATGHLVGRLPVSEIARRWGALAAINGDFFLSNGAPAHAFATGGRLLKAPGRVNTLVGFDPDYTSSEFFGAPSMSVQALSADGTKVLPISRVNDGVPSGDQIALVTPESGVTFPAGEWCRAVLDVKSEPAIDSSGATVQQEDVASAGCTTDPIPDDTDVLVAPPSTGWGGAVGLLPTGERVTLQWRLDPTSQGAFDAMGANITLVFDGAVASDVTGNSGPFYDERAPRTAIAQRDDGTVLLVTVDGRQDGYSIGMTPREFADYLVSLDVDDAANLDGGGSTAMAVHGVLVNRPSDSSGERGVGSALVVVPAGTSEPPPFGGETAPGTDPELDEASLGGFERSG